MKVNGAVVIATFAENGALKCSGLEVERYSVEKLARTLGPEFHLIQSFAEDHVTPWSTVQPFVYTRFKFLNRSH